ncbi:MAG: hypothetical protein QMD77_00515 [Patescibacteria group bacterium]|nr:hypothetical protein [Patescibacteria group bacterium]
MRTKRDATKAILEGLLFSGMFVIAAYSSPYFLPRVMPHILKHIRYKIKRRKERQKFLRSFYYLKREGFINIEKEGKQIYISLTKEGKRKTGRYHIDNLEIKKPKKWDQKWRMLIFDIEDRHKIKREALRGKLKQLGLYKLQKSVWICPHDFFREMETLRDFFGLKYREMRIITASMIENDDEIKSFFGITG